jgi:ribosomal protein L12E/L44/L45/RPP1/RPP2
MMDVYIRESDLTTEQNELRKKRIDDAVKAMQKAWTSPPAPSASPPPASQPRTE